MHGSGSENAPGKRLRRFTHDNSASIEMGLLVAWVLFLLFVLIPWIMTPGG
jgi:hypothetical protein